ncbi:PAS domain S-box protein [Ginsengibacter hankyongi]|uniref:histidine kinase n=1 Tax=Ginsengibacter hankyongi TaxID=2607284 RepID=A0A5J5II17_9BACT|nr:PAS domain S-box protein [Ginsengibacter hankyongi]KAA9040536.1 PAS domain S-box protein [Ginsengibacter hankyongi]
MRTLQNKISKLLGSRKGVLSNDVGGFSQREALLAVSENLKVSNRRLKDANRELNTIFNKIDEALFSVDVVNNIVTQMSIACEKISGYTPLEFKADFNLVRRIIDDPHKFSSRKICLQLIKGDVVAGIYRIRRRDEEMRWIEVKIIPTLDDEGVLYRLDGIAKDITDQKLTAEKNRETERRYRLVSENPLLGIGWCSTEGKLINANEALCSMLGYTREEIEGKHFCEFSYAEDLHIENPLFEKILNKEINNYQVEKRYIRKNEEIIWVLLNLSSVWKENGEIDYFIGIVQDINQRKEAEQNLKVSYERIVANENMMKAAEELAHFGSWEAILKTNITKWSAGTYRIFGYEPNVIQPSQNLFIQHIHPADRAGVTLSLEQAIKEQKMQKLNFRIIDAKGAVKYIHSELIVECSQQGETIRLVGFNQDVTEKVRLENRLLEEKRNQLREVTQAVITTQENERTFLAGELHDNINPTLATAKLYLDCAIQDEGERINRLLESKGFINDAMNDIRKLSRSLAPPSLGENKLRDAVADIIKNIDRVHRLQFNTIWEGLDEHFLSEKLQLAVYRIIQEQFNNILKYARAKSVTLHITQQPGILKVRIKDDGVGFDKEVKRNGLGLRNISNRAAVFNGSATVNSLPGEGCELLVTLMTQL